MVGGLEMIGLDELIRKLQQSIGEQQSPAQQEAVGGGVACRICGDTGIVCSGDVAWICDCQHHNGKQRLQDGIAPELRGHTFEDFRVDYYDGQHRERALAALKAAREFTRDCIRGSPCQGIMFTGDVGAGKTFLAAAVTNELLNRGIQAQFLVVPDFLDDLRTALLHNTGDSREPDDVALLRSVRRGAVLILDDLGAHNYTEWTCNKLYTLLNYRLNYQLPVIITTNLKMSELDEHLGERTTSRIVQMCRIYRLTVDKDIRHIKNQARFRQEE
jgi:DNA replication protein DnaC